MLDFMSVAGRRRRVVSLSRTAMVAVLLALLSAMSWAPGAAFVAPAMAQSAPADPRLSRAQREMLAARLNDRLKLLQRDTELGYRRFLDLVGRENFVKLKEVFDSNKPTEPLPNGVEDLFQRAIKDYVEYEPQGSTIGGMWPNTWPEKRDAEYKKNYAYCVGKRVEDFLLERQRYLSAIIKSVLQNQRPPSLTGEVETGIARAIRAALTVNAVGAEVDVKKGIHWYMSEQPISSEIPPPNREGLSQDELDKLDVKRTCPIRNEDLGASIDRALGSVPLSVGWDGRCLQTDELVTDGTAKTPYHPTAAALMYNDGRTGLSTFCSGTLIAPNAVLTAAHCVCDTRAKDARGFFYRTANACINGSYGRLHRSMPTLDPAYQTVFLPHAGHFEISHMVVHPQFRWTDRLPVSDLAILFLKKPVPAIAPMELNTMGKVLPRTRAAAVGYGAHNPIGASGAITDWSTVVESTGLKLQADIETGICSLYERSRKLICWRYRVADRFGMRLGSTCRGDSGGPLYAASRGKTYLVGVTSGGGPSCQPTDTAFDIEVFAYKDWIQGQLAANPPPPGNRLASSPSAPASDGMKQAVCHFCPICDQLEATVKIPDNARRMRIAVHCTPDDITGRSELKLSVSATGDGVNRCRLEEPTWAEGPTGTAISCVVDDFGPERQPLHVTLNSGLLQQCQIVATAFDRVD